MQKCMDAQSYTELQDSHKPREGMTMNLPFKDAERGEGHDI